MHGSCLDALCLLHSHVPPQVATRMPVTFSSALGCELVLPELYHFDETSVRTLGLRISHNMVAVKHVLCRLSGTYVCRTSCPPSNYQVLLYLQRQRYCYYHYGTFAPIPRQPLHTSRDLLRLRTSSPLTTHERGISRLDPDLFARRVTFRHVVALVLSRALVTMRFVSS